MHPTQWPASEGWCGPSTALSFRTVFRFQGSRLLPVFSPSEPLLCTQEMFCGGSPGRPSDYLPVLVLSYFRLPNQSDADGSVSNWHCSLHFLNQEPRAPPPSPERRAWVHTWTCLVACVLLQDREGGTSGHVSTHSIPDPIRPCCPDMSQLTGPLGRSDSPRAEMLGAMGRGSWKRAPDLIPGTCVLPGEAHHRVRSPFEQVPCHS